MEKKLFADFNELKAVDIPSPAMKRQIFFGENVMLVRNVIKSHTLVPMHKHPHEQITYFESGECDARLETGEKMHLKAGGVMLAPANVGHEILITSDEDAVVFDVFSPIREDFLKDFE